MICRVLPDSNRSSPSLKTQHPNTPQRFCFSGSGMELKCISFTHIQVILVIRKGWKTHCLIDSYSLGHCLSKCGPGPPMPASPGNKKCISLGPTESESLQVGPVVSMFTTPPANVKTTAPSYFQNSEVLEVETARSFSDT